MLSPMGMEPGGRSNASPRPGSGTFCVNTVAMPGRMPATTTVAGVATLPMVAMNANRRPSGE
jgi:hypothetical protein